MRRAHDSGRGEQCAIWPVLDVDNVLSRLNPETKAALAAVVAVCALSGKPGASKSPEAMPFAFLELSSRPLRAKGIVAEDNATKPNSE